MSLWLNKFIRMSKKMQIMHLHIGNFQISFGFHRETISALLLLKLLKIVLSVKPQGDSDGFHEHVGRNRWYEMFNTR